MKKAGFSNQTAVACRTAASAPARTYREPRYTDYSAIIRWFHIVGTVFGSQPRQLAQNLTPFGVPLGLVRQQPADIDPPACAHHLVGDLVTFEHVQPGTGASHRASRPPRPWYRSTGGRHVRDNFSESDSRQRLNPDNSEYAVTQRAGRLTGVYDVY